MAQGNAKRLGAMFVTKKDGMFAGTIPLEGLETLVKAAKIEGKECVKFLGFKAERKGYRMIDILAEPCDKNEKQKKSSSSSSW